MSKNLFSIYVSILLTALTLAIGSRLIWGIGAYSQIIGFIVIGLPIVIILFALYYCLAAKVAPKFQPLFLKVERETAEDQNWPKSLNVIGYVEVATGTLGSSIFIFLLFSSTESIISYIFAVIIMSFVFASGYLLLSRKILGLYLSLISQMLTLVNFSSEN